MDACDSTLVKTCSKCKEVKPITEFTKDKQRSDGLRPSCKACKRAWSVAYYEATREKQSAYAKAWAAANPEKKKANKKRHYEKHAQEVIAKAKEWRAANLERAKEADRQRYWANPDASRERTSRYRQANPEYARQYSAEYRLKYPERVKASAYAWRQRNAEKVRQALLAYKAKNPDANRIQVSNRRAKVRQNGGKLSRDLTAKLYKLQKGLCPCCRQPLGKVYHLDHIIPLALGGPNTDENMQLLRATCNQQKHAKHPVDFMQSKGFLL